jgi:CheY-like chemotaxis protein
MIFVESELCKGTIFTVYLPLLKEDADLDKQPAKEAEGKRGTETVLIGEDNETLRKMTKNVLENNGYTVILAEDGKTALTAFEKHRETIDIIILDLMMPGKRGFDVYREIVKEAPQIKVLFVTGYSEDEVEQGEIRARSLPLLFKPYTPFDFLRRVREILDNKSVCDE